MCKTNKEKNSIEHDDAPNEFLITRRTAMFGMLGVMLMPVSALLKPAMAQSTTQAAAGIAETLKNIPGMCRVATAAVEGPYYIDKEIFRSDIRENQPGVPLELELCLVNSNASCNPIKGAVISIWHCNAEGRYSGYLFNDPNKIPDMATVNEFGHVKNKDTERFLRGAQTTDEEGKVTFNTIVPGWYTPRAAHIHVRAFLNDNTMMTTQLYFPQALLNAIQSTEPAYKSRGVSIYTNEDDVVRAQSGISGLTDILSIKSGDNGVLKASMTLGVGSV